MAVFEAQNTTARNVPVARLISGLWASFVRHNALRETQRGLYALSPEQLDDIGLTRWDINNLGRDR